MPQRRSCTVSTDGCISCSLLSPVSRWSGLRAHQQGISFSLFLICSCLMFLCCCTPSQKMKVFSTTYKAYSLPFLFPFSFFLFPFVILSSLPICHHSCIFRQISCLFPVLCAFLPFFWKFFLSHVPYVQLQLPLLL